MRSSIRSKLKGVVSITSVAFVALGILGVPTPALAEHKPNHNPGGGGPGETITAHGLQHPVRRPSAAVRCDMFARL